MIYLILQSKTTKIALALLAVIALLFSGSAYEPGALVLLKSVNVPPVEAADSLTGFRSTVDTVTVGEDTTTTSSSDTNTPSYTDISPSDWFYEKVITLASSGIISGYRDGSFRPGKPATRAEVASLLMRAKGLVVRDGEPFYDVRGTDWFYGGVVAVFNAGLMNGTSPGYFSPMALLTREQASAIMVRSAGLASIVDVQEQELWLQGFKDRRTISGWAKPYVAAAVKYGLMNGYPSQEFKPAAAVNRAEICTLIWNLLYRESKPRDSYPGYVIPYPLKPNITAPLPSNVIYGEVYTVTAEVDPYSSTQELWINGRLAEIKYTSTANMVTFSNVKTAGQKNTIRVVSRNASGSAYSSAVTLYHFSASPVYKHLIIIDRSEFQLYWIMDGFVIKIYRIAIGMDATPTPLAKWIVGQKLIEDPTGVYGPRRLRLYRLIDGSYYYTSYGIHGTNEPWVIGTQASHGCIRLRNEHILELWPQVNIGDHVITQE